MKHFFAAISFLIAALVLQGVGPASAASMTGGDLAAALTADSLLIQAQGYGGGGGGSYNGDDAEDGNDDDGDNDGRRYRRRYSEGDGYRRHYGRGEGYCRSCAYRCSDGGWCPPRCWGWWRECRSHRRRDY